MIALGLWSDYGVCCCICLLIESDSRRDFAIQIRTDCIPGGRASEIVVGIYNFDNYRRGSSPIYLGSRLYKLRIADVLIVEPRRIRSWDARRLA